MNRNRSIHYTSLYQPELDCTGERLRLTPRKGLSLTCWGSCLGSKHIQHRQCLFLTPTRRTFSDTIHTQAQCKNPLHTNLLYKHICENQAKRCVVSQIATGSVFATTATTLSLLIYSQVGPKGTNAPNTCKST
jgi:hypothetical protein